MPKVCEMAQRVLHAALGQSASAHVRGWRAPPPTRNRAVRRPAPAPSVRRSPCAWPVSRRADRPAGSGGTGSARSRCAAQDGGASYTPSGGRSPPGAPVGWEQLPSLSCVCGPACVAARGPVHEPRSGTPHGSPGRAARARAASHCAPRPPSAAGDTLDMAQDYCGRPCGVCARGSLPARTNSAGCAVAPRLAVRRPPVLEGPQGHPACGEPGDPHVRQHLGCQKARRAGDSPPPGAVATRAGWGAGTIYLDRPPQILEEMPAVCYLDGIWGTPCHPRSIRIGAVPRDHPDLGMRPQPRGNGLR